MRSKTGTSVTMPKDGNAKSKVSLGDYQSVLLTIYYALPIGLQMRTAVYSNKNIPKTLSAVELI